MNILEEKCRNFFAKLDYQNLNEVNKFYAEDAKFVDPLTSLDGVKNIYAYYENLYKHVTEISFEFDNFIIEDNKCSFQWIMNFKTKKLNSGKNIKVYGISTIKFNENNLAIYHRDYYDMGEFIYERIPVLNKIISYIKKKLKS